MPKCQCKKNCVALRDEFEIIADLANAHGEDISGWGCSWDVKNQCCGENAGSKRRAHGYEQYCKWCGYVVDAMDSLLRGIGVWVS